MVGLDDADLVDALGAERLDRLVDELDRRHREDHRVALAARALDNGGRGEGYLGNQVGTAAGNPQTTSWSNGVWKREFQGGVVLWNPKGSGTRTVNVSGLVSPSGHAGLKHILGTQNPSLNNGYSVTSVTLRDRDGLILLWVTP